MNAKKIKRFFLRIYAFIKKYDIGYLIVSLLLGFIMWAFLSNGQDPIVTRTVNVPVTFLHESELLKQESRVMLTDNATVSIEVSTRKSRSASVSSDMFECTADIMTHQGALLSEQLVHVSVNQKDNSGIILNWEFEKGDPYVTVALDDYITKTFPVLVMTENTISGGLKLQGDITFSPDTVDLSGPSSAFGNIASVYAVVDLSQLTGGELSNEIPLTIFDANGKEIKTPAAITMDHSTSTMHALVLNQQAVKVLCDGTVGTPAEGYRLESITVDPDYISVKGLKDVVSSFTEIVIPSNLINISGVEGSQQYTIDISSYIPEGVTIVSGSKEVTVSVVMEKWVQRTIEIPIEEISIENPNELYSYEIFASLKIKVRGFEDVLDALSTASFKAYIDVENLEPGNQNQALVHLSNISGVTVDNPESLFVRVLITEQEPSETPTEEPTEEPTEPATDEEPTESESEN